MINEDQGLGVMVNSSINLSAQCASFCLKKKKRPTTTLIRDSIEERDADIVVPLVNQWGSHNWEMAGRFDCRTSE